MTILFSELTELYYKSDFNTKSGIASYHIDSEKALFLVKKLTSVENQPLTRIELIQGDVKVGSIIELEIRQPKTSIGWLYDTFDSFLKADFQRTASSDDSLAKPFYIKGMKYSSEDIETPEIIKNYTTVKSLLLRLSEMSVYQDTVNHKLVFVSKKTFELHYNIQRSSIEFKKLLNDLTNQQIITIKQLCNWLSDDKTSKHIDEKKSILAFVLASIQQPDTALNIIDVLKRIQEINQAIRAQYDLYLEDFKYENFVKKLEENSEKFINRVNDSISKVLSQVLALPIAAAIPALLRGNQIQIDNIGQIVIALALIAYATICYFALTVQSEILKNIKNQVEQFEENGKIPSSLKEQWLKDKEQIDSLIKKQGHLYYVMITVVFLVIIYGGAKLCAAIYN